jgi:ABC-type dipeptide/oligopeptide/nickel transport system permease subunit
MLVQLGYDVIAANNRLYDAPWASLWPGLAIYASVMGFLTLHYGLKEPIPMINR